uniref:Uncharacterized protein n=1 Tax=Myotis myotis TaxID=51298 RepID=A0A7J7ZWV5_MYOMY|nr:hypothetical protein mMyoMyo1_009585 [Myotis myotis]
MATMLLQRCPSDRPSAEADCAAPAPRAPWRELTLYPRRRRGLWRSLPLWCCNLRGRSPRGTAGGVAGAKGPGKQSTKLGAGHRGSSWDTGEMPASQTARTPAGMVRERPHVATGAPDLQPPVPPASLGQRLRCGPRKGGDARLALMLCCQRKQNFNGSAPGSGATSQAPIARKQYSFKPVAVKEV